jgi:hypothetical protein
MATAHTDLRLHAAHACLEASPPPTLRDILQSYKRGGDGDRELLLSMLNAKAAEDQVRVSLSFRSSHSLTRQAASC